MQCFYYNGSLAHESEDSKASSIKYLGYLKNIFDNVLPKVLDREGSEELKLYIVNSAKSLQSDDIIHSCLSFAICNILYHNDARVINKE